jgi:hypothetical protein
VEIFENFADPSGPLSFLTRFAHVLAGVTWIGLLYFFNFVQVPAYAELSDGARSEAPAEAHLPGAVVVPLRSAADVPVRPHAARHPGRRQEHGPLPLGRRWHRDPHRHALRHHHVPQRVGRHLAQPEGRDRQRRDGRQRRRGQPRGPAAAKKAAGPRAATPSSRSPCSGSWSSPPTAGWFNASIRQHARLLAPGARAVGLHRGIGPRPGRRHRQRLQQARVRQAPADDLVRLRCCWPSSTSSAGSCCCPPEDAQPTTRSATMPAASWPAMSQ